MMFLSLTPGMAQVFIIGFAIVFLQIDISIRRMFIIVVGVIVISGLAYTVMSYANTTTGTLP